MRPWRKTFAAAAAAVVLSACGHVIPGTLTGGEPFDFWKPLNRPCRFTDPEKVEVRYLGAGNVYIKWREEAVLIGPFFSNAGYFRSILGGPKPDLANIEQVFGALDAPSVRAILAGHAHYDHIADLPEAAARLPKANVYVNSSAMRMLAATKLKATQIEPGWTDWVSPSIRVRALASTHAPQLCGLSTYPCVYGGRPVNEDWSEPWNGHPLFQFGGGDTLAFVIELRDPELRYRIFYNDAAGATRLGDVTGPFDLAILTAAQWNRVDGYPGKLLKALEPKHVVVSHWENFLRRSTNQWKFVFRLNPEPFIKTANELAKGGGKPINDVCGARNDNWTMPVPGASMLFSPKVIP